MISLYVATLDNKLFQLTLIHVHIPNYYIAGICMPDCSKKRNL